MIDKKVLDEILPVPDLFDLKDEKVADLKKEGVVITNFSSGGIFYHLLMIACKMRIEVAELLRNVLNDVFLTHARGTWIELKAADFSKKRKKAIKTRGYITISREKPGEAVKIPKGYIFKTPRDINGEELRYFTVEDTVLQQNALAVNVVAEAEKEGARYNVPPGQINRSLLHIEGIDGISNPEDWIVREGADIEDYESLRDRGLGAWSELATLSTKAKFINVCMGVPGVLFIDVHDRHPRGQGTVDIIVTGTAGQATPGLLEDVRKAAYTIRGPYDDILVKSSVTVSENLEVEITVSEIIDSEGLEDKAALVLSEYYQISRGRKLNQLLHADVIHELKGRFSEIGNVRVLQPERDVVLSTDYVVILGTVSVTVREDGDV